MTHLTIENPGTQIVPITDDASTTLRSVEYPAPYVAAVARRVAPSIALSQQFLAYAEEADEWATLTLPTALETLPEA